MKNLFSFISILIFSAAAIGCSSDQPPAESTASASDHKGKLICKSTVSPNEAYIKSEADKVVFEVNVYQEEDHSVLVTAQANTPFFEDMSYLVKCDTVLSESDVDIQWTTAMGNLNATEEEQLVVATVTLTEDNNVISQRKINFAQKAIEIIVDAIDQNTSDNAQ